MTMQLARRNPTSTPKRTRRKLWYVTDAEIEAEIKAEIVGDLEAEIEAILAAHHLI